MSTPGVSLFQGAESIQVNSSLERAEEEEALEDQRRRNEEIGNLLQNAFDDLEDDETTIDSTNNFPSDLMENKQNHNKNNGHNDLRQMQQQHPNHYHHQQLKQGHVNHAPSNDNGNIESFEIEMHKLKMLLESKNHELENLKQIANDESQKRDEFQKRLIIAEAELDRALAGKKNTHELLVESKEKCSNLENTISKLRNEKKSLEAENNTLLGKLETSQTLLSDVQRKYDMVERDLNKHNDRNVELKRRQMEERHRAEIEILQQQLEQVANKLDRKTNELENMSTRYMALQNSHETMLVDKASKINDLNNALNEAQSKCEELMSKPDYFQENIRLQKLVASLQDQIQGMERNIKTLQERLEFTTAELNVMDSVLHQHNMDDTPRRLSQTQGKVVGSTPLNTVDRVVNLKDELYRALANIKVKRDEIRKLHQTLDEKNNEIRILKEEENKALVQITTLKDQNIRLENRVKILEEDCDEMRSKSMETTQNQTTLQSLNDEVRQLRQQKMELIEKCNKLEDERNQNELERRRLDGQLKNVEVDLEELKQEHESMKANYEQIHKENQSLRSRTTADSLRLELEKHKFLLKDAQTECDRLKNLYVEISNKRDSLAYEVEKLRNTDNARELQEEREKVANLQRAVQLAEVKAAELIKILETEKLCHERDVNVLKEKMDKEKTNQLKALKDSSNNCTKCMDYMAEVTKFEIQNLKLTNVISTNRQEIDDLTQELNASKALIAELNEKLKLSEQQEKLIKELKTKAHTFEEYIKSSQSSANASPKAATCSDKSVATSPEMEKSNVKKIESRIRDEMAKIFAIEIKRYQTKLHEAEEKNQCLQREYRYVSGELQQRHNEVDLLKQAILAERERMEEILKEKQTECQELIQKQNALLHKCRDELKAKNQKVADLCKELAERQQQIEAERKSMKAVMQQWEEQRKNVDAIESEWRKKLDDLKRMHDDAIALYEKKYNSAKRTAANYKRYADDKEAHMMREYERLESEYRSILLAMELRLKQAMGNKYHREELVNSGKLLGSPTLVAGQLDDDDCDKENKANN